MITAAIIALIIGGDYSKSIKPSEPDKDKIQQTIRQSTADIKRSLESLKGTHRLKGLEQHELR